MLGKFQPFAACNPRQRAMTLRAFQACSLHQLGDSTLIPTPLAGPAVISNVAILPVVLGGLRAGIKNAALICDPSASPKTTPKKGAGPLDKNIKVVGMGSSGVDYLASVAAYPEPDEKLRTEKLEVQGGGNAANALTAAARLGLRPSLVTKIGGDGLGDGIISELKAEGVETDHVLRAEGHPSPFTYIIVDRSGGTRTCIHTPGAAYTPDEMTAQRVQDILKDAQLVYFDGRLTEAAILLAQGARAAGVPVLVEAERLRPRLEQLLPLADYVVTSAHFPQDWTGETQLEDAILSVTHRLPSAKFVITTLGTRGSVMLERSTTPGATPSAATKTLVQVMADLQAKLPSASSTSAPDCVTAAGLEIRSGTTASTSGPVALMYSDSRDAAAAASSAASAAQRAAALNADAGNASGYRMSNSSTAVLDQPSTAAVVATVTVSSIATLSKEHVVDTTGAGDAFIGSILYGLATGMSTGDMVKLAGLVAAAKCTQLGARPGLPTRQQLNPAVLS